VDEMIDLATQINAGKRRPSRLGQVSVAISSRRLLPALWRPLLIEHLSTLQHVIPETRLAFAAERFEHLECVEKVLVRLIADLDAYVIPDACERGLLRVEEGNASRCQAEDLLPAVSG
jgi:hypothetical protein